MHSNFRELSEHTGEHIGHPRWTEVQTSLGYNLNLPTPANCFLLMDKAREDEPEFSHRPYIEALVENDTAEDRLIAVIRTHALLPEEFRDESVFFVMKGQLEKAIAKTAEIALQ